MSENQKLFEDTPSDAERRKSRLESTWDAIQ